MYVPKNTRKIMLDITICDRKSNNKLKYICICASVFMYVNIKSN